MIKYQSSLLFAVFLAYGQVALANQDCELQVNALPSMAFDKQAVELNSNCENYTFVFSNDASSPMKHNLVIALEANKSKIATEGFKAGEANSYIPNDPRVVASLPLTSPGQEQTVTVPKSRFSTDDTYLFFCTMPGHSFIMKGSINFVDKPLMAEPIAEVSASSLEG